VHDCWIVAWARPRIQVADERAWTTASGAGTMVAFNQYLGQFPAGAYARATFSARRRVP
jgi:hypothetical protein